MQLKIKYLVLFVLAGIAVMTVLVFNSQARKEVLEAIQQDYENGNISEQKYKDAMADGKLSNWEVLDLKK